VKVYTFEPAPDSLATLRRNVALNALSNVTIFGVAVSSRDGEARLHLAADSGCNSLIQRSDVPIRGDVKVETWSMERVLKTIPHPVNLLKMDIEGMEYETLFSCPSAYLQRVERIALEYHDDSIQTNNNTSELISFLMSSGFSAHVWPERRILFAERNNSV
jgi:FkbM family methyltransferase